MAWNPRKTILEKTTSYKADADVIFTAAFIGLAIDRGRQGEGLHVTMEPEIELDPQIQGDQRELRTKKDKQSMDKLNNLCRLVNHVIGSYAGTDRVHTMSWGFCPTYTAGGMIAGGEDAARLYEGYEGHEGLKENQWELEIARKYLTHGDNPDRTRPGEDIYIGRGAYCGLAVDEDGNALSAMSTLRTTISPNPTGTDGDKELFQQIGARWSPPDPDDHKWGMIVSAKLQDELRKQGMQFWSINGANPDPAPIVGYTHGMIRAVYECMRMQEVGKLVSGEIDPLGLRIQKLVPYEMSLGVNTFKLASCIGCSFFMFANGYAPSATHLGRAESWLPLYHTERHSYAPLIVKPKDEQQGLDDLLDKKPGLAKALDTALGERETPAAQKEAFLKEGLRKAIKQANDNWAKLMTKWMQEGSKALDEVRRVYGMLDRPHQESLAALHKRVDGIKDEKDTEEPSRVCCNLLLDAFTDHKSDYDRVLDTLQAWWGDKNNGPKSWKDYESYRNPFTDDYLRKFPKLEQLSLTEEKEKAKGRRWSQVIVRDTPAAVLVQPPTQPPADTSTPILTPTLSTKTWPQTQPQTPPETSTETPTQTATKTLTQTNKT